MSATLIAGLRKAAGTVRLNVDKARGLVDDAAEVCDAIEAVFEADMTDSLDTVDDYVAALADLVGHGYGVTEADLAAMQAAAETLRNLMPDLEGLETAVEAHSEAVAAVEACEEHRDAERGEFDTDTKQEAREEAQTTLDALADAIVNLEPVETPAETT